MCLEGGWEATAVVARVSARARRQACGECGEGEKKK